MTERRWNPDDRLGDERLDREHEQMIDLVRRMEGTELAEAGRLLEDLDVLAHSHFEAEEARMRDAGYYRLAAHRAEHRLLLERIGQARRDLPARGAPDTAEDLAGTLLHHIREVDRLFANFLQRRGP